MILSFTHTGVRIKEPEITSAATLSFNWLPLNLYQILSSDQSGPLTQAVWQT